MSTKRNIILIDGSVADLTFLKGIIYSISPEAQCISFVYADEAAEIMLHEFKRPPQYILIDADTARIPALKFLRRFRQRREWDTCTIGVFSSTMPVAVAEVYKTEGADFAFQKPLNEYEGVRILTPILSVEQSKDNSIM